MGDGRTQRFDDALSSLVDNLVPTLEEEDEATADERHDDALELARNIIEDVGPSPVVSDVQHAADLIKKRLLRDNESPEKAVQFSNLYSRLLSQPVLSKKWEILYLLHKLAERELEIANANSNPNLGNVAASRTVAFGNGLSRDYIDAHEQTYKDAFATGGLPRLPVEPPSSKLTSPRDDGAGRNRVRPTKQPSLTGKIEETTAKVHPSGPTESSLLRDVPYLLQGLSTLNFSFTEDNVLQLPSTLSLPVVSILHTLAEPSLLYRNLSLFVESKDEGLIGQSLRSAVQHELRSYLGLISSLETQIRQATGTVETADAQARSAKVGVTLKRCVLWTREATMGLRLMSLIAEEAKNKKGGQLITLIHGFSTSHGDPFVGAFAERLLSHVTRPFYDMLRHWVYDGELSDPYHEFMVMEKGGSTDDEDPRRAPAKSVWEEKYTLDGTMVPSIMTEDFARKVFLIGKSLNFIRYSCGDSAWVEAYSKGASRELNYGDTAMLETSIDKAYKITMARLIHLMDTRFQLFGHLRALKRYLLLGQGDFIALLMESLAPHLDKQAGSQYRHTLTSQLEHAIRGSNAQFDSPDTLRRLDARLTEMERGDTGWDVFTLEYKVDAPVDVIITQWANTQYLKIFNLLWRVKRVEFALGSTWRRCMTGARGVLASVDPKTSKDWKHARCAIAEMIHFIDQLQYYILFEVIEASWDALHAAISKSDCTLDDLISSHNLYLRSITHKGLLGSFRTTTSGHKEDIFTVQLHEILKLMLTYKDAVDGLYSYSLAEFTRKQELAAKVETRTAQGKWGLTAKDDEELDSPHPYLAKAGNPSARDRDIDSPFSITSNPLSTLPPDEESMLPALRNRLTSLSADFKTRISNLLGDLAVQPDVDMKFLAVVMNFNDVYQPNKRRRHRPGGAAGVERKTPAPNNAAEARAKNTEGGSRTASAAEEKGGAGASGVASKLAATGKGKGKEK